VLPFAADAVLLGVAGGGDAAAQPHDPHVTGRQPGAFRAPAFRARRGLLPQETATMRAWSS
jgi:hypothetical protein